MSGVLPIGFDSSCVRQLDLSKSTDDVVVRCFRLLTDTFLRYEEDTTLLGFVKYQVDDILALFISIVVIVTAAARKLSNTFI